MHRMRRFFVTSWMALTALAALGTTADATLLKPAADRAYPDVAADINGVINYTYDPTSGLGDFHVTNTPYLIAGGKDASSEFAVVPNADGVRQQVLNITLDSNGNLVSTANNTYALYGTIQTPDQTFSGLLLQGTPTAFGSQDLGSVGITGQDVFDTTIDVTGGALQPFFGSQVYMRLTPEINSTFTGSFATNFSAEKATSNTRSYVSPRPFPVPEPTALLVLVAGGFGLVTRRRLRARTGR